MKRCLITGASRGIGRAIAERLAGENVEIFLHGRDPAALAETAACARSAGATAHELLFDLSDCSQVLAMIGALGAEPLDLLVNNAGMAVVKPLEAITTDEWQKIFAVNVTAPFLLTKECASRMQAGSSIVNILSVAAKNAFAGWSAYCMSKFALDGFMRAARDELRGRGVRVINIYPAATDTEIWRAVEGTWPREKMMPASEVAEAVAYALARPGAVLVEDVTLGSLGGAL
jgi:NAD(P)-dependent dehydrogenase (short-subunit alcohol dehydrogenase family)